jgi:hypothetical protein
MVTALTVPTALRSSGFEQWTWRMSEPTWAAVTTWSVESCPSCGRQVAVLYTAGGSALRLEVANEEAPWLVRGRHPAYASHLRPVFKEMAERSLRLELKGGGPGVVSSSVVADEQGNLRSENISPALALLMFEATRVPLWVDEALLSHSEAEHHEDLIQAFSEFLATVKADDFAQFDR